VLIVDINSDSCEYSDDDDDDDDDDEVVNCVFFQDGNLSGSNTPPIASI